MVELVSSPLRLEEQQPSLSSVLHSSFLEESSLSSVLASSLSASLSAASALASSAPSSSSSSSNNPGTAASSDQTAFGCPQCPKSFTSAKLLQQHQHMFHTDKSFVCEICGKAFRFRSNLAEHRSVHTALKPYVCKYCGKSSRLKGNLTKHILKHHKREQAEQVSKDDIIVRKEHPSNELMAVLQQQQQQQQAAARASPAAPPPTGGLAEMVSFLPREEKSDPDYERAIFLSFGLDQGSMDLTGGSPGSSDNGTDPAAGSHDLDSEISGSPLPTSTIGGASSLQALLAQVSSTPSSPPPPLLLPLPSTPSSSSASALLLPSLSMNGSASKTQCPECGKHFRKVSALQLHLTLNHGCAPPASSISSVCEEKMIIEESEAELGGGGLSSFHADLRQVQAFMNDRFSSLEQSMRTLDGRMSKMEKNVDTVLKSMYSLVQLQTGLNSSVTRIRDDMGDQWSAAKTKAVFPTTDV